MGNRLRRLDTLEKNYDWVIFDSNALVDYFTNQGLERCNELEFCNSLIDKLDEGKGLYISQRTIGEYLEKIPFPEKNKSEIILARYNLIRKFRKKNHVLFLKGEEPSLYNRFARGAIELFGKNVDVQDTSFNLFANSLIVHKERKRSVAMISNNINAIGYLWKKFIANPSLDKKKFGFYKRVGQDSFQEI